MYNMQRKISLIFTFSMLLGFPKYAYTQTTKSKELLCKQRTIQYLNDFELYKKSETSTRDVLRFFEKQNDENTKQIMPFWVNTISVGNEAMLLDFKQRINDITWIENEVEAYINQDDIIKVTVPITYRYKPNPSDEQPKVIQVVRVFQYNANNKIVSIVNESFIKPKDVKKRPANHTVPYEEWKTKKHNDAITIGDVIDSIVISSSPPFWDVSPEVESKIKLVGTPKNNDWYLGSSLMMSPLHLRKSFLYQDLSRYSLTLTNSRGLGVYISNTQSQRSSLNAENHGFAPNAFAYAKSTLEYEAVNQNKSFEYVSTDGNLERNYVGLSGSIKRESKPSSFFLSGRFGVVITRGQVWDYYSGNLSLVKTDNGYYISDLTDVNTIDFQVGLGLNMAVIKKVFLLSVNADITDNGSISNSVGLAFRINNYKK